MFKYTASPYNQRRNNQHDRQHVKWITSYILCVCDFVTNSRQSAGGRQHEIPQSQDIRQVQFLFRVNQAVVVGLIYGRLIKTNVEKTVVPSFLN